MSLRALGFKCSFSVAVSFPSSSYHTIEALVRSGLHNELLICITSVEPFLYKKGDRAGFQVPPFCHCSCSEGCLLPPAASQASCGQQQGCLTFACLSHITLLFVALQFKFLKPIELVLSYTTGLNLPQLFSCH